MVAKLLDFHELNETLIFHKHSGTVSTHYLEASLGLLESHPSRCHYQAGGVNV